MLRRRTLFILVGWIVAFAIACSLDTSVARTMHETGFAETLKSHKMLCAALKAPGEYWFAVLAAIAVFVLRGRDWKSAVFLLLATAMSGTNGLVKWIVGRTRPYKLFHEMSGEAYLAPFQLEPFRGGLGGLFRSKNLGFPSGHACMAFAVAESLAMLWPRGRWAYYAVASVTATERFSENAHYLSDCVAGAAIGIVGVHLIHWFWFSIVLPRFESPPTDNAGLK